MNYGFIGTGNLVTNIVSGLLKSNKVSPDEISIFDTDSQKVKLFREKFGVHKTSSAQELVEVTRVVFLGVKPNTIESVLNDIKNVVKKQNALVVSLAAGRKLSELESFMSMTSPVMRVMTNLNTAVCKGISAICYNSAVSAEQANKIKELFSYVGETIELDEKYFPTFLGLASSSPAMIYLLIDSIARAGVKAGIDKPTALKIASQAVLGSAEMLKSSDRHPWDMIDSVCSPGGATIEGITSLLDERFEAIIMNAVAAFINKDSKI